jgi:glucose-1-phosphate cytidylyltransferase
MKVVILAGGLGTRLSEETNSKPKPMVEVGGKPILWHIMKTYAAQGFKEFIIALGYKGEVIKDYFINYLYRYSSLTVDLANGQIDIHNRVGGDDWTVHLVDTGVDTQTGGRIKLVSEFIGDETFMLTYGDGVADVDLKGLVEFHQNQGKIATVTAVRPPARFGSIVFDGNIVDRFKEKTQISEGWINGGFFVLEPKVQEYISDDLSIPWELAPMERLAQERQLAAYRHNEFWQCMDTLRDVHLLEKLWAEGSAPWKMW